MGSVDRIFRMDSGGDLPLRKKESSGIYRAETDLNELPRTSFPGTDALSILRSAGVSD